jgi:hypothetical protein
MLKKSRLFTHPTRARRDAALSQARPQRVKPEAYHLWYVEGLNDARTQLAGFFSILLKDSAVAVPYLSRHIAKLRQMKDSLGNFLS